MTDINCLDVLFELCSEIDMCENELIKNMMNPSIKYDSACIGNGITYTSFFESLKPKWENTLNKYISEHNNCEKNNKLKKISISNYF